MLVSFFHADYLSCMSVIVVNFSWILDSHDLADEGICVYRRMMKEGHLAHHLRIQLHRRGLAALVSLEDCSLEDMLHAGYAILTLLILIITHI